MTETTELIHCLIRRSMFWKNLEAQRFHSFLTDSPTKQSDDSEISELPDSSK